MKNAVIILVAVLFGFLLATAIQRYHEWSADSTEPPECGSISPDGYPCDKGLHPSSEHRYVMYAGTGNGDDRTYYWKSD